MISTWAVYCAEQAVGRPDVQRNGRQSLGGDAFRSNSLTACVLATGFAIEDLDRLVAVNIRGVLAAIRYAAPHLIDGGRIVTIGSNTAERIGAPGSSVYAMTKASVAQLVRGASLDFAPCGITVNNVQPGPIETDMTADLMEHIVPRLPLGRIRRPDEIADLVA